MLIHPTLGYRLELLHRPGSRAGGKPATPGEAALREGYGHVAFDVTDLDGAFDRAVARGARPVMPPGPSPEPGCGWRSSPTPRVTSSSSCTGPGSSWPSAAGARVEVELVPGATHFWNGASDVNGIVRRSIEFLRACG